MFASSLTEPPPHQPRVAGSICLVTIRWYWGQIEFLPPEEDYVAPLFPVLFYKWKVWLWNPSRVSCCWWILTWPRGAGAQGTDDKAFWWSCSLTFLNCLPGLLCFSCNDFCHVSMSERGTVNSQVSPSNGWVDIWVLIFTLHGKVTGISKRHYSLVSDIFSSSLNWHYPHFFYYTWKYCILFKKRKEVK